MKFCPNCEKVLFPSNNRLYCKGCSLSYILKKGRLVVNNDNDLLREIDHASFDDNNSNAEYKKKSDKDTSNSNPQKTSYLTFFPYEHFRREQESIIKQIEKASQEKKNSLLAAPNGTGKTIIALSAMLPLAIKKNLKIIYLCRTHSQNTRIIKELTKISNHLRNNEINIKVNGLSIRGRNEMCLNEVLLSLKLNPRESMAVCSDLRKNRSCKFFLNLIKKRDQYDNLINIAPEIFNVPVDAEDLIKFCSDQKLCPYFLSKFLLKDMKLIICNYQWLFNPSIRQNFMQFIDKELTSCILVLDECHNVIDIATEVNSDRITPYSLRICLKDLEIYRSPTIMQTFVKALISHLDKKKKNLNVFEKEINAEKFLAQMYSILRIVNLNEFKNFINDLLDFSASVHEEKLANGEISRDYLGSLAEFWIKWIKCYLLENYFFCYNIKEVKGKSTISIEIVALDPREIVIPILKECYTSLHLSGTVNPYVYNNLMSLQQSGKSYKGIIAESPFQKKNIKAIITEGVDTRRENRNPPMFKKMLSKIEEVISSTPANIGIFCASYKILNALANSGIESIAMNYNKKLFIEEPGLSASENAELINDFKSMASKPRNGAILLGVCGGRNSEGEDYPGDHMNSVIIAGFPYHLPTPRVNAKIEYYDKVFNKQGWNFAYLYPAIQRANQASGRPIRKIKDKGVIIFMDSRFKQKAKWIAEWIRNELELIPDKPKILFQNLNNFWKSN
ncbi:MAG TPA: helicase C-terminal domain-containing protein [Candidatus Nanopelagicaceae bacterium]|nr:helicase C-terminal domain-containing protein [Candidatus Nanopelagicaceae bacterium]